MVNKWIINTLSRLLPSHCPICDRPQQTPYICNDCKAELPVIPRPCYQCAKPLPANTASVIHCGDCQSSPPAVDHINVSHHYHAPLTELIAAFKFQHRLYLAPVLAELMLQSCSNTQDNRPQAIIAVPLHASRQRQRGFNQSLELARFLARELAIPVLTDLVQRQRATAIQSELPADRRAANVRGAFTVASDIPYQHIALIDDVITTGSTVNEIARMLKKNGVTRVDAWCVARAI